MKEYDAILTPGGAIANLQGMLCARHKTFPDARLVIRKALLELRYSFRWKKLEFKVVTLVLSLL